MKNNRPLSASERWFRLLLRLYPADFREDMGRDLVETYQARSREASSVFGLAGVWFAALRDSLRNGLGERARPAVSWRRTGDWGRDMEMVSRRFRRKPLFLVAVLGTLTVGLGTFAVVYTAVDKILIEPLPYREPDGLYKVWAEVPNLNLREGQLSGRQVMELRKAEGPVEDAVGFNCGNGAIPSTDSRDAFHINMMDSSPNLFDVLGVHPSLGRTFQTGDADIPSPPIVLGDGLWRRLGANPAIVGTSLRIGPDTHTIIGVMPPDFGFSCWPSQRTDVYRPFNLSLTQNGGNLLTVIRARGGASPEQVHQAVDAFGKFFVEREPKIDRGFTALPGRTPGGSGQGSPSRAFGSEFRSGLPAAGVDGESRFAPAGAGGRARAGIRGVARAEVREQVLRWFERPCSKAVCWGCSEASQAHW